MALSLQLISTTPFTLKQQHSSKFSLSSFNNISSSVDRSKNATVTIKRKKLYSFTGKSKSTSICCNSIIPSDVASTASAAYGALLLGGGLFAYTRTGSKGSLLGGVTGGVVMSAAYFLMQESGTKDIGDALAFGSALLFSSVFGIRLAATRKIMPAAPLLGLSVAALAVFFSAYMQDSLKM